MRMVVDWQMAHPFWTGMLSGVSLGFWPDGYAIPRACTAIDEGMGVPTHLYAHFVALAFPAYRMWAALFVALFAWLYLLALSWAWRRALMWLRNRKTRRVQPS
ncbi:hypothetical protein HAP93_05650 [Acidithiobacillus ferriphilus]|uniref:hypothetical protein n=1 Tax=Acidithiobacillus ferriphilus TaxID=1689834 RepID=UPI001C060A63|nr:hypothetical protein [Acidithiobacillus ferriphilus]MBU2785257.1 hypothetical protein [Acidithiobacillus ferriphilus]